MNLLCYLLDSCDSELRTMIFLACSYYMPVPLIANRPSINFRDENSEGNCIDLEEDRSRFSDEFHENDSIYLPRIYEEITYSFEKYKGVLSFKVNTNKDRSLRGCTTITNKIFNR